MPRHLRMGGDVSSVVSIPVGASLADARRQLVIRTFASTGGDHARTARMLGVTADELRGELEQFVREREPAHGGAGTNGAAAGAGSDADADVDADEAPAKPALSSKASKTKRR